MTKPPPAENGDSEGRIAGESLAELDRLRYEADARHRFLRAWQVVLGAVGDSGLPVVLDFALEHGLVVSCEGGAERGQPARIPVWVNPVDGSEMVWIPAGPFYVGPEKQRRVESQGFSLARFPVTNAQFQRFLDATTYVPPLGHPDPELFLLHWTGRVPPPGRENHPVVWVSYLDALHYCQWAGLALPTEWLWEKAARGRDGRAYPWGDEPPLSRSRRLANVGSSDTWPVGSFPNTRSAYGCEDMIGNVSEWCRMIEDEDPAHIPEEWPGMQPPAGDVVVHAAVRGSCFLRKVPRRMVSWHRRRLSVTRRNQWVGFRPAVLLPCRPGR